MNTAKSEYIHGYSEREMQRLEEQSSILERYVHSGTSFKPGELVLEAGCGVGAQTAILSRRNPGAKIVSIDVSEESIRSAKSYCPSGVFLRVNATSPSFKPESFDHIFICFVLEHLDEPVDVLLGLKKLLKPGGTITAIEGDHEACGWTPMTADAMIAWRSLLKTQQDLGHDPMIGRRLYPIFSSAGLKVEMVEPRVLYADGANPELLDGMVNKIIVPMTKTAKSRAIQSGYATQSQWEAGIKDLEKSGVPPEGTFFYSWFKAVGRRVD